MSSNESIFLSLQGLPPLLNQILAHGPQWRMGKKRLWRQRTYDALDFWIYTHRIKDLPWSRVEIFYTRYSSMEPDSSDAIQASFKWIQDAIITRGVTSDDNPKYLRAYYQWKKAKRNKGYVTATIKKVPPEMEFPTPPWPDETITLALGR